MIEKIPTWALIAVGAVIIYYLLTKDARDKETLQNLSQDRINQLTGGQQPTISEIEAANLCRRMYSDFEGYWSFWHSPPPAQASMQAVYAQVANNNANAIRIAQEWRRLYGNSAESHQKDIVAFLQAEYFGWGEADELRNKLVQIFTQFAA